MATRPVSPLPTQTVFPDDSTNSRVSWFWLKWFQQLVDSLNNLGNSVNNVSNGQLKIPGPYANDAAAAAAGVAVGQPYYVTGATAWMVTRVT